jgi:hypothetical protein
MTWTPAGPDLSCRVCHEPAIVTGPDSNAAALWLAWGCPNRDCPSHAALDAAPHTRAEGKSAGAPGATPVAASADDQLMGDLDREGLLNAAWLVLFAFAGAGFAGLVIRELIGRAS